ncbi:MAG: CHC2 zinc finger domain-containing protein [Candidatus Thiodiazotropha lotti]|nr:CHC2 zinc finger domain-containing protein [Candidatus Thiodiazotropha lotti]MCW4187979.1 CHC2 zinc finger domain-containing protein [Candidatus Thiodiazotropha lotti]
MIDYKRQTEELNNIPVSTVGTWLGLNLPRQGSTNCPFPDHDDNRPSFSIDGRRNSWICYGCNRKGGAIDLVKEYLNLDFLDAKKWLAKCNGKLPPEQKILKRSITTNNKVFNETSAKSETVPDYVLYEKLISLCPLKTNGRDYLIKRAISKKTIYAFNVGQIDNPTSVLKALLSEFGFDRVKRSGVLTKRSTSVNCRLVFLQNSIVFPFMENGRIAYLQARHLGSTDSGTKWRNLNERKHRIYNVDALANLKPSSSISICEGVMDTLSAVELGLNAVGLLGVSASFTVEQIKKLKDKQVNILLDWDIRGNERASQLQDELKRYGVVSTRKFRPTSTANDLNEYLVEKRGNV